MDKPVAIFYAGTNGAGKSTLRDNNPPDREVVNIDPDAIAREINPNNSRSADIAAGRRAAKIFAESIEGKRSFSMETTLTGHTALTRMKKAKEAGFEVQLYYVGLDNVERNIERVADRVRDGGHHIDTEVIRKRYFESLRNLPKALTIADHAKIYSNDGIAHTEECSISNNALTLKTHNPVKWVEEAIKAHILENGGIHWDVRNIENSMSGSMATANEAQEKLEAAKKYPELTPAYGLMRACEAKAETDGLNDQQRAIVMARVRQNVANSIERGELPEVKLKEEKQITPELGREPKR